MTDNIIFTQLDNDVHWLKLKINNRQAIEDMFAYLDTVVDSATPNTTLRLLMDNSEAQDPSFSYLVQRSKQWEASKDHLPPMRFAIIKPDNNTFMSSLVNFMMRMFGNGRNRSRVFNANQFNDAVWWLGLDD